MITMEQEEEMQESTFTDLETMFLALADRTRLRLLALMADAPMPVGLLADGLNESQPKVSRHLATLRNAGLVTTTRDGKWVYYEINYPRDNSQRRILESLVRSIATVRVGGEYVYFRDSVDTEVDIYAQTDIEWDSSNLDGDGGGNEELEIYLL